MTFVIPEFEVLFATAKFFDQVQKNLKNLGIKGLLHPLFYTLFPTLNILLYIFLCALFTDIFFN